MKLFHRNVTLFLSTVLFSTGIFANAPMKDEAIVNMPYHWTGFYAGINAGFVRHSMSITDNQAVTFNATIEQKLNPKLTGGLQAGYRYQLLPSQISGVFGIEISDNFSDASFHKIYGSPTALYQLNSENTLKNLLLLQAISGIAVDRTFIFLALGLSWVNVSGSVVNTDGVPFFNSFDVSKEQIGGALGGGVEYAFNDKFSLRFKVDVILSDAFTSLDNAGNSYQVSNNILQGSFGLNYKFG